MQSLQLHISINPDNRSGSEIYRLSGIRSAHKQIWISIRVQVDFSGQTVSEPAQSRIDLDSGQDLARFFVNAIGASSENVDRSSALIIGSANCQIVVFVLVKIAQFGQC